jgi:hypothetical protein
MRSHYSIPVTVMHASKSLPDELNFMVVSS